MKINRNDVIDSLRGRITNFEIEPGQPLSESVVAQEFEISRTLVREILRKLESEYLLEIYPNRGAFVTDMSLHYIEEIFQMREAIEGMAARIAAERIPCEEMERLRVKLKEHSTRKDTSYEEAVSAGDALHSLILDKANNKPLKNTMRFLNYHFLRIRNFLASNHHVATEGDLPEHLEIIDAILGGNGSLAEKAMRNHIRNTKVKMFMRLANKR
jgi:DNA-binding GntR family transcriptional regulator